MELLRDKIRTSIAKDIVNLQAQLASAAHDRNQFAQDACVATNSAEHDIAQKGCDDIDNLIVDLSRKLARLESEARDWSRK